MIIEVIIQAPVAQLDRARASDARCRKFESCQVHFLYSKVGCNKKTAESFQMPGLHSRREAAGSQSGTGHLKGWSGTLNRRIYGKSTKTAETGITFYKL